MVCAKAIVDSEFYKRKITGVVSETFYLWVEGFCKVKLVVKIDTRWQNFLDSLGRGGVVELGIRLLLEYIDLPLGYGPGDLLTLIEGYRDWQIDRKVRSTVKIVAAILPFVPSVAIAMGIERLFPVEKKT